MKSIKLAALLFTVILWKSQAQPNSNKVLFTLGKESHSVEAFNHYFLKNNEKPSTTEAKKAVQEYLDLYIDFRLKVQEAFALNMDQETAFIEELGGYEAQLIEPYLATSAITEELVQEAYNRLKYEVSGSHILIAHPRSKDPIDTLKAYNRLLEIKEKIDRGADFSEMAVQYSEDRSAKQNKGYLGYFTAMQMVYPFENAAYNNDVGDVVGPVRTRFGYHLLRIEDRRKARGKVSCAHIMARHGQDTSSQQKAEAKIRAIYANIQAGKGWNEQCKLYSDDKNTAQVGGQLRWFGTGEMVPEFEDVAFALPSKGSISTPFKTKFGWHIVRLIDKKGLAPLAENRREIETKIARDVRTSMKKSEALEKVKQKYDFKIDEAAKATAFKAIDSVLLEGKWATDKDGNKSLFSLGSSATKVADFWSYVQSNQKRRTNASLDSYINLLYNRFEENIILEYEKQMVRSNNPEYQMMYDEYKSGILLFNLMEKEVWNRAMEDSVGMRQFYDSNKKDYERPESLSVRKLVLNDTNLLDSLLNVLDYDNEQLEKTFNPDNALTLQASDHQIAQGENDFLDEHWSLGNHVETSTSSVTVWVVQEVLPKGFKELEEIRGKVISDYQKKIEEEWLNTLKEKYTVKVNKKALKEYIQSF